MNPHSPIAELGDGVGNSHQQNCGAGGGENVQIVPGNVHIDDIITQRFG